MNTGKKKNDLPNPRAGANCFSSITYAWTIPIFKTGFNRDLDSSDLYTPLDEHSAGRLGDKFSQLWNEELKNGTPSLARIIFQCFKWKIIFFFSLTLILDCVIRISQPIFLGKFISYFTAGQENISRTQLNWYAFGLIMSSLISVVLAQTLAMALLHLGLKIKIACCSLIYRKSLKLSKTAIGTTTVGQVVNLLANDVNRVETITHLSNYLFVGPIQTLIITVLMWQEIGISAFIGVVVLLSAVPLQFWLGKKIAYFRRKTVSQTDERMQRMSEIIAGIRVIKMYAWEESFSKMIEFIRKKEMKWIAGSSSIRGFIVSFALFHARLALFCSIICYAALGNQITAQKVFVVTSYYTLLKQSMNSFFPRAISFVAEFLVATKRINRFLLFEETIKPISTNIGRPKDNFVKKSELSKLFVEEPIEEEPTVPLHMGNNVKEIRVKMNFDVTSDNNLTVGVNKENTDEWNKSTNYLDIVVENEITLDKVYVKWIPFNSEYNLSSLTLTIKKGSFVAIVGSVGSGKSTLLNTILKEIPLHMGTMDIHGEVSYASQDPWLFDATIRENILFGSKMDRMRYNRVIQKCALDKDFKLLPHGDKTLAGELGCNLSGGQKARVNLARAVYRQADIYLFDDPLSAVDAHVGRQLFDDCMAGFLENKTRLLVTHQLQYLDEVERIIVLSNGCIVADGTYDELENSSPDFKLLSSQVLDKPEAVPELDEQPTPRERLYSCKSDDSDDILEDERQEEQGKSGSVDSYVYRAYLMATGSKFLVLMVLLTALATQLLVSSSDYWTSYWVNMEEMKNAVDCYKLPSSLMENISQINDYSDNNVTEYYMETTASIIALNSETLMFSNNNLENITSINNDASDKMVGDALGSTESIIVSVDLDKLLDNLRSSGLKIENLMLANDSTGITESAVVENSDITGDSTLEKITNNYPTNLATENDFENTTFYLSKLDNIENENISYLETSKNLTSQFCCENIPSFSYTKVYTFLIIFSIVMVLVRSQLFFWAANRASSSFHRNMFDSISRGTMRFFNMNPSGRILNRFAKDMSAVDEVLPTVMIDLLQISISVVGIYLITILINFWLVVPIIFSVGVFVILRTYYISTSRSVFRLVGMTRSPTLSHLSASLQGITTIRAFGNQRTLEKEFDSLQNIHTSASYLNIALSRAFGFWLDSTCVLFIATVVLSFVFTASSALGGNVGLVISQVMGLVTILQYALRISTQMENEMISVERILDYVDIEHEPPLQTEKDEQLPPNWPQDGRIVFNEVSLRYSPTKAPAIRELSVVFNPKKKIGIVGRTGAGKSSIINAIFRLEFIEGTIEIDGYNTSSIGLLALRSRLSIIPQEPVLFSGSIRTNLDPFDEYSDEQIWNALEQVELKSVLAEQPGGLSAVMSEGGTNFSVGQRQLFCLARAIIRDNPILILDEATANVDQETDALIQRTIRTQFADCTVLTIAHRLQTVMDSDKVLVMDAGRMVEYDHPYILLQTEDSFFQNMAKEYGKSRMEAFLEIAKKSYEEIQQNNYK